MLVLRNRCKTESKKISIYLFCRIKARRFLFYCSFQRDSIACRCFNDIKSAWLWANILPTFLFNSHFLQISGTAEICHHPGHSCKLKNPKHQNLLEAFSNKDTVILQKQMQRSIFSMPLCRFLETESLNIQNLMHLESSVYWRCLNIYMKQIIYLY